MDELVITIVQVIVPWVIALCLAIALFWINNQKLPTTIQEWKDVAESALEDKQNINNVLGQVISFFDQDKPMEDTPLSVIKEYIPASTYQMNDESQKRVLSTCSSEEEKQRVLTEIFNWENPTKDGEECCDYELVTSGATYRVQYGVPEIISDVEYKHLSQNQISDIVSMLEGTTLFTVMWEIMKNERAKNVKYTISGFSKDNQRVNVYINNGEYSVEFPTM